MKNMLMVGVCALMVSVAMAQGSGKLAETSARFAAHFMDRAFDEVVTLYTSQMKAALSTERSGRIVDQLVDKNGPVERIGDPWYEDTVQGYRRYRVPIVFENVTLDMRVVFDANEKIAGLFFVQHSEPPETGNAPGSETEVPIGGPEKGLPEGDGPFPAALLVHGSGPNDRDETVGPNKPFRDIAWGLAKRGVATLRYDKRSYVYPGDLKSMGEALTVREEVIDDARAALDFLYNNPSIKRDAVYLIGHSLGGNLAPRIAAIEPRPAGVVILAGNTRPLPEKMLEQERHIFMSDGKLSPAEKKSLDELSAEAALIRAGVDGTKKVKGFHLGAPIGYYKDLESVDAPHLLAKLDLPCLILQGGRDYQVTLDDFAGWQEALSNSPQACLHVFDKLDHLLREGTGPSSPTDYDVAAPVSPALIDCIAKWIHDKTCCGD
jgi:dienelactone hydrolase